MELPRENCSDELPLAKTFFTEIPVYQQIIIGICGALTLITIVIFCDALRCIRKKEISQRLIHNSLWLLGLYPVFSCTSFLAIAVPKSSLLDELFASGFLSIGLYKFLGLMILYYGGEESFLDTVEGTKIPLRSPPLACCCCCCPSVFVNKKNFTRISLCVLQCAFVRPILLFLSAVLWTEGLFTTGSFQMSQSPANAVLSSINTLSTLTAMYAMILIYRASKEHLKHLQISQKFVCLQLVLVISNLQKIVFNILATNNVFPCYGHLSGEITGNLLHHSLLILEMFLLSLWARKLYINSLEVVYTLEDTCPETIQTSSDSEPTKTVESFDGKV